MVKKVKAIIKLQIQAGKANPSPPVGPSLGQHGINIMEFCNAFNDKTKEQAGALLPVVITLYEDKKFTFVVKQPPMSALLKKSLNLKKGSATPNKDKVGTISREDIKKIAEQKMPDLNATTIEAAMNIVAGSAASMGIIVEDK